MSYKKKIKREQKLMKIILKELSANFKINKYLNTFRRKHAHLSVYIVWVRGRVWVFPILMPKAGAPKVSSRGKCSPNSLPRMSYWF